MSKYKPEDLKRMSKSQLLIANSTDTVQAMLRAGADAMEKISDEYHVKLFRAAVREQERADKAEARVKELEGIIDAIVKYPRVSITISTELYDKARAALQVKP